MKQLNTQEIQRLGVFNDKLKLFEEKIYNAVIEQSRIALQKISKKGNNIVDYALEVTIYIYGEKYMIDEADEHILANYSPSIKPLFLKDKWSGIYDDECHNTTSAVQKNKELNSQKHCWLLHSLYDIYCISWKDMAKIDTICYDIEISYEYKM